MTSRTQIVSTVVNPLWTVDSAWETQASWCQVPRGSAAGTPSGTKSAPQHRDFAAEKEEVI